MEKDFFHFKSFKLRNRDCALKINSDGVLLAAWAKLSSNDRVLDIGTGGGVIAFILKKRFPNIKVHGIDIDRPSIEEAQYNITLNNWENISFESTSLQAYSKSYSRDSFDHIISNPPFHVAGISTGNRYVHAKHSQALSFSDLITASASLLSFVGKLSLIVPFERVDELEVLAHGAGLHKTRIAQVRGKKGGPVKRVMMEFCKRKLSGVEMDQFFIRKDNHDSKSFGEKYKLLTKDLYLDF